jgi:RNase H-fold protein (predicted Holliday junction resolvase)
VKDYEIMTIVVGAPLGEADEATAQATKTAAIVDSLTAALPDGVNIVQVNEFASTQEAQERFPDVDKDAGAAAIILERYLETLGDAAWSQL